MKLGRAIARQVIARPDGAALIDLGAVAVGFKLTIRGSYFTIRHEH